MALSKQSILKHAGSFVTTPVHIPEWKDEDGDDVVLVRGMTIREYELNTTRAEEGLATASVLSRCIVDETGGRVFDDSDVRLIAELPLASVRKLDVAITKQSGLSDVEEPIETAIADAEGNSPETPSSEPVSS